MRLYHFVCSKYGLENLQRHRIKIATYENLNDPFELNVFSHDTRDDRTFWNSVKGDLADKFGILCFCKGWKNPLMWSHYADRHRGMALGFDVAESCARPIRYSTRRPRFSEATPATANYWIETKSRGWSYEREYRVFARLEERDSDGLYFKDFDETLQLREVIVGPRSTVEDEEILSRIAHHSPPVRIVRTRLAFKTFHVVENRRYRT